uniref:Inositol hexakisphosphate and diphosphoinositol-pentakisphosphate kinase n=1 Tax=Albugo laibachii Nc14 TaxID=890382 RepID=F0WAE3_9STRA|nr:PREDICTED: inositol hexakisphosphate and diphosphoinositolpentakisphosphate kinase 2like isoform 4 putative [Albugo laibachii Nc14]|eukprot:CCA18114.1 PREDICTED: inositol hexakisphosphate and diphosphoinositolpentakisphosphate kinase 2like isoform 4 putative [Albugo laibachii Nc14]
MNTLSSSVIDADCVNVDKYVVGICAMEKKTRSKPMLEILKRLEEKKQFDIHIFSDDVILNKEVDKWPICDVLISFYSSGFPLEKADSYCKLHHPILVNDLKMQREMFDRRKVYAILSRHGIPVPRHAIVNRDIVGKEDIIEEEENYVIVNGVRIDKPLVEKPVDAEDHNIHIYYPTSAGGGSKKLFRKIGDRSSEFYPNENRIRRDGSYIYEEFVNTQGTDVKVYTVGSSYGHAEARKSPVLDGKVMRDMSGKEIRYPVILNSAEKEIARKVCLAFHQTVCGFDLLRVRGNSFVCDVNGWSFVKSSKKYYDDCGLILHNYLVSALRSRYFRQIRLGSPISDMHRLCPQYAVEPRAKLSNADTQTSARSPRGGECEDVTGVKEELRCVIAVVRHGDRTPKQKLKTIVWEKDLVAFFKARRVEQEQVELKVKSVSDLQELLDLVRNLIKFYAPGVGLKEAVWEVEAGDSFEKLLQMKRVLERWKFAGINRKVQFKPLQEHSPAFTQDRFELLMILKWGGDLTPTGQIQGEGLGRSFRNKLYPLEEGGLLRLHSTFRHDLKIFTSDEGRVQMTAAAFAKGFLELEGDLTPILVSLVTTLGKDANKMLDHSGQAEANEEIQRTKCKLKQLLHRDYATFQDFASALNPIKIESISTALNSIWNPTDSLSRLHDTIRRHKVEILELSHTKNLDETHCLYVGETFSLMLERWEKLYRDFYSEKSASYDLSKIPDIFDCIKYDLLHNHQLRFRYGKELYDLAKAFAGCYVPQEYGMEMSEKQSIGVKVSQALCAKIRADIVAVMSASSTKQSAVELNFPPHDEVDLMDPSIEHLGYRLDPSFAKELRIKSPSTQVRTRLYFTSESHMYTLLNVLRFQCPRWHARHQSRNSENVYDISLEEEEYSNEILKEMGISVSERMPHRKYLFSKSKMISDCGIEALSRVTELNYLAHVVIRVFEKNGVDDDSEDRFRVEISFSPGVVNHFDVAEYAVTEKEDVISRVADRICLTQSMTAVMFEDMLAACVSSEK